MPVKEGGVQSGALKDLIQRHGSELSSQLQAHHRNTFPPEAEKTIRHFTPAESARLIGIHEGYLRQITSEGKGFFRPLRTVVEVTPLMIFMRSESN